MKPITVHHLEIKHNSLAAELRIIRRKEAAHRKWKRRIAKEHKAKLDELAKAGLETVTPGALAGIRKYEYVENRNYNPDLRWTLREHRLVKVKPEARAAHLALGYLKGMPYRKMETIAFNAPNWAKVWYNVLSFGGLPNDDDTKRHFLNWADAKLPEGAKAPKLSNYQRLDYTATLNRKPSELIIWHLGWKIDR
jgi:hypothetical protein